MSSRTRRARSAGRRSTKGRRAPRARAMVLANRTAVIRYSDVVKSATVCDVGACPGMPDAMVHAIVHAGCMPRESESAGSVRAPSRNKK